MGLSPIDELVAVGGRHGIAWEAKGALWDGEQR